MIDNNQSLVEQKNLTWTQVFVQQFFVRCSKLSVTFYTVLTILRVTFGFSYLYFCFSPNERFPKLMCIRITKEAFFKMEIPDPKAPKSLIRWIQG